MQGLQRALRRAERQRSVLKNGHALQCGLSQDEVDGLVERGEWRRPYKGVYIVGGAPPDWRQRALVAVMAGPPGTVASHLTAGAVHELWRPPSVPHITVPPRATARIAIARVHRSTLGPGDR